MHPAFKLGFLNKLCLITLLFYPYSNPNFNIKAKYCENKYSLLHFLCYIVFFKKIQLSM